MEDSDSPKPGKYGKFQYLSFRVDGDNLGTRNCQLQVSVVLFISTGLRIVPALGLSSGLGVLEGATNIKNNKS